MRTPPTQRILAAPRRDPRPGGADQAPPGRPHGADGSDATSSCPPVGQGRDAARAVTGRVAVLTDAGFRRVALQPRWDRTIACRSCGYPLNACAVVYVVGGAFVCFRCLPRRGERGAA